MTDVFPPGNSASDFIDVELKFGGYLDAPLFLSHNRGTTAEGNITFPLPSRRAMAPIIIGADRTIGVGGPAPIQNFGTTYISPFGNSVLTANNQLSSAFTNLGTYDRYGDYTSFAGNSTNQQNYRDAPNFGVRIPVTTWGDGPNNGARTGLAELNFIPFAGDSVTTITAPKYGMFATNGNSSPTTQPAPAIMGSEVNIWWHSWYNRYMWFAAGYLPTTPGSLGNFPWLCEIGGKDRLHADGVNVAFPVNLVPDQFALFSRWVPNTTSADARPQSVIPLQPYAQSDNWCIRVGGGAAYKFFYLGSALRQYGSNVSGMCDVIEWTRGRKWYRADPAYLPSPEIENAEWILNNSNTSTDSSFWTSEFGYVFTVDTKFPNNLTPGQAGTVMILRPDWTFFFLRFSNPANNATVASYLSSGNSMRFARPHFAPDGTVVIPRSNSILSTLPIGYISLQLKAPPVFKVGCWGTCNSVPIILPQT